MTGCHAIVATVALGAVACSASMGWSLEVNAGAIRANAASNDPAGETTTATAWTAGLSLALEYDWLRDAVLGLGFGYQTLHPTGAAEVAGSGVSAEPMHVWFASAIGEATGWNVRPRVTMGGSLANGDGDLYADGYVGLGASIHPKPGTAIHVLVGPQIVRATDRRLVDAVTYQGWGGQVRVRLFRMFKAACDPATLDEARGRASTRSEMSCWSH